MIQHSGLRWLIKLSSNFVLLKPRLTWRIIKLRNKQHPVLLEQEAKSWGGRREKPIRRRIGWTLFENQLGSRSLPPPQGQWVIVFLQTWQSSPSLFYVKQRVFELGYAKYIWRPVSCTKCIYLDQLPHACNSETISLLPAPPTGASAVPPLFKIGAL